MVRVGVLRQLGSRRRGLVLAAAFACSCGGRSLEPPMVTPDPINKASGPVILNRNVDILFLVDNSASMAPSQNNLLANFPVLMNTLQTLPGGLPNVHIAVISSDMGAGDGSIAGCDATGGDRGNFQYTPRGTCTQSGLAPGATFISNVDGQANYSGNLSDVFTCIAALGEAGCGFEHQFASLTRALGADGKAPPLANQGFLRPDAYLAIVMITNEDDCSASPGVALYDTTSNVTLMSQLGPPANFRCNEFGHLCSIGDGAPGHPFRDAPGNDVKATATYTSCTSNDTEGYLLGVADTAARLKALKPDPESQILFAAITGPQSPYTVQWKNPSTADTSCGAASCPWPEITHSCTAADGSFADPSVRVSQLAGAFGSNGLLLSICDADFAPALQTIADKIIARVTKPCVTGQVAKRAGTTSDDCTVATDMPDGQGGFVQQAVPACADTAGAGPCWRFSAGDAECAGQVVEVVPDPSLPAPTAQTIEVQCAVCSPGVADPARGCP
jgi:hypothetical protein